MCTEAEIRTLLKALHDQPVLAQRGFSFRVENGQHLLALRGPHLRGVWRCEDGEFAWTAAGYGVSTHAVRGVDAALRYTLVALATSS